MSREKTARLIPNAIQICTSTEKVFGIEKQSFSTYFPFDNPSHKCDVNLSVSSPTVLLHFLLCKREKLSGSFPHVAKHAVEQGKALTTVDVASNNRDSFG